MVIEYIRYELKRHEASELIAAYGEAASALRASPECLGFDLSACEEVPNVLVLRIHWTSTHDHLQGFRKGPQFASFFSAIKPFVEEIAEMRHYRPTGLQWVR